MSSPFSILAFGALGGGDYLIILFLCLMFFGSKKLPELAKGMGQAMREFKKAANDVEDNFKTAIHEEERKKISDEERKKIADEERRKIAEEERQKILASTPQSGPPNSGAN
jgi:sec-independent protein translocase protein TatA